MNFKRFKQIWNCLITDRPKKAPKPNAIVMEGFSEHTIDSLVKASHGDFSDFDKIDSELQKHDSRTPLDELIDEIVEGMTSKEIEDYKKESYKHPGSKYHFWGGMNMRNSLHLWEHDTPLTKYFSSVGIFHGDDRSGTIYKALWCRLMNKPLDIKAEADFYKRFWAKNGLNADGSPIPGFVSDGSYNLTFDKDGNIEDLP